MAYYRRPRRVSNRGSRRRGRGGSSPSVPMWVRTRQVNPGVPVGDIAAADLLPPESIDQGSKPGRTVVRLRGSVEILTAANQVVAMQGFYVACAIMGADDIANVTPSADANDVDWFYYQYVPLSALAGGFQIGADTSPSYNQGWFFDAKSSRRIYQPLTSCYMIVEPTGGFGAGNVQIATTTSLLLK